MSIRAMSINGLIVKAENGTLTESDVMSYCENSELSLDEFAHEFSRDIVLNYSNKTYSYTFADEAMNWLYGFMTDDAYLNSNENTISDFPLHVYLAFDAGEYHRSDDPKSVDPILKYTNPKVEKLLSEINS